MKKIGLVLLLGIVSVFTHANSDIPQFKDYPAKVYGGKSANLLLNNETAKLYRTRFKEALAQKPVFAGEYIKVSWGCGIECVEYDFINKRTGQVVEENLLGGELGDTIYSYRLDSKLLVAHGIDYDQNYNEIGYNAKFYVLENGKFKLIKKVPIDKPKDIE